MRKKMIITLLLSMAAASATAMDEAPLWLRKNAISPDGATIAFTYKGNIFTVPTSGGKATQITGNAAYDSDPMWSKDGKTLVFASYREGSKDLYRVCAEGGTPVRLTSFPGNETPLAVLKDGTVLFSASIQQDSSFGGFPGEAQVYATDPEGGKIRAVTSLPICSLDVNADGTVIYEDHKGYEDNFRKHHTSSVTRDIWMCRSSVQDKSGRLRIDGQSEFRKLTAFKGEDRNPVFGKDGDTYYYLSEQSGSSNIFRSSLSSPDDARQLTFFSGNPVRYLSVSDEGTLSFSYDGELYVMKDGGMPKKLDISIVSDDYARQKIYRTFASGATDMAVSPNGKEVAFIVRGNVFVTSVENATTRRVTDTAEQERDLSFSKDGKTLYYSSERDGNWGIWASSLKDKNGKYFVYATEYDEKRITPEGVTCFQPQVSPDGKSIAYLKDRTAIEVMNIKSGKTKTVLDKSVNYSYSDGDQSFEWSPDSRYILCNWQGNGGWNNQDVALIEIESGKITDLTQSGYSDGGFRWALNGKAMTWTSDRAGYRSHGSWGAEDDIFIMFFDSEAYSEFRKDKEEKEADTLTGSEKKDSTKTEKKSEKLVLNLDDRHDRTLRLSPYSGRISDHYLTKDGKKLYYMVNTGKTVDLCVLEIESKSFKIVASDVRGSIYPSSDGSKLFILSGKGISCLTVAGNSIKQISFTGDYDYKPVQEREYIFSHIWKQVEEKFYDPKIHGTDWTQYKACYEKFLPHINNNFDFQEMLSEMLGELNGSHTGARYYYRSGLNLGKIGVLFDLDYNGDGLKIDRILKGGALYCAAPEVEAGDIIVAVDGDKVKDSDNWFDLFGQKAGKKIRLSIKKGGKLLDITVKAEHSDTEALYRRWVEQRAEMVEKLSGGRIGYVHVKGMDSQSFRKVFSDLLGKYRSCEAVIVDTRHNGGGWLHDDLATLLSGKAYVRFEPRRQYIGTDPYNKWNKPSCVLIGEDNYSDASGFPYIYKTLGIGKLIGAPVPGTMTAVWWETQIDPTLVFGIPQVGVVGINEGRYLENMEIEPDITVYNDPASLLRGEDKQLETAVSEMLKSIGRTTLSDK